MEISKSAYYRLSRIDSLIRTGTYPNCSSIAKMHEVHRRTILRDIEYMKDMFGAPIEYNSLRKGYYYTQEFSLPNLEFLTEGDLFSLCIAERSLEQYRNTPVYDDLARVFHRISACLPDEISVKKEWIGSHYSIFSAGTSIIQPGIWETLAKAVSQNRRVTFEYVSLQKNESTTRSLDCYHIFGYRGDWYAVGFCYLRKEVRTFSLSRIENAVLRDDTFTVPADFNLSTMVSRNFGITDEGRTFNVEVEFTAVASEAVKRTIWHPDQKMKTLRDGSLRIAFPARSLKEVKGWILSYGDGAKAVKPKELADEVAREIKKMAGRYR